MSKFYPLLRRWAIVFMALIAICAVLLGSPVQATVARRDAAIPNPQGWHLLYNVAQGQCINLTMKTGLQRCSSSNEEQQYAIVYDTSGSIELANKATAQCLDSTQAGVSGHNNLLGTRDCSNPAPVNPRNYFQDVHWALQTEGPGLAGFMRYALSDEGCLSFVSPPLNSGPLTFVDCNANNDKNQLWQFR